MLKNLTIKSHLVFIIFLMAVTLLAFWLSAMFGMSKARDSLRTVYEDRVVALDQLTNIEILILQNRLAIAASLATPTPDVIRTNTAQVEKNIETIGKIWDQYMATYLTPEETILAANFTNIRNQFITQGLQPVIAALRANDIKKSNQIVVEKIRPLYQPLKEGFESLSQLQLTVSRQEYEKEQDRYVLLSGIFSFIALLGLGIAMFIGNLLFRAISNPLGKAVTIAQKVAAGDYQQRIQIDSTNEIGQLMQALKEIHDNLIKVIGQSRDNEAYIRAVLDNADEGIIAINECGEVEIVNHAAEQIFGYTATEIIGQNVNTLTLGALHGQHDDSFKQHMGLDHITIPRVSREVIGMRKDGTHFPLAYKASEICINSKLIIIAVIMDLTEQRESEEHIQTLAYYDVLTGLPNRTLLHDRLGQLIAEARRDQHKFALLYIDLDRFMYINDSMGHTIGDKLLQIVAVRLQECVREVDTVSHISGDEFVILLRDTDAQGAAHVADDILTTLATPCTIGTMQIATHASIGISLYPKDADKEDEINTLIKHADVAMHRVKAESRSNFLFYELGMNSHVNRLFSMENDIRLALERNEFTLHYQPQVNLTNGMVCGAEALLRWKHPEKGFISPAEFIPVAEETGQIVPIGEWVLRTACAQLAKWRRQGMLAFPISVNLSITQLHQPHLTQLFINVLEETKLSPQDLELEITEGVMADKAQPTMAFLHYMHKLGVKLAIDDFGTGYSSLSYLKKMPIDRLKVDQSFVRDITTDENDAAIVRSIINLGHQLKLQVIAEGVETMEQLDFLRARGCDEIQGYFYSRPLPAEEFAIFINSNPKLKQNNPTPNQVQHDITPWNTYTNQRNQQHV
jgi:diguanylate cyclase (GGDEF)-like protein/PAS domain S-box-containing protein